MDRGASGEPALKLTRIHYAVATIAIFAIEVVIALFVKDWFVRPYVGDTLAVMLVYAALRTVTRWRERIAVLVALGAAFVVEFGQLFRVIYVLGLGENRLARLILGTGFDVRDLAAYSIGALGALGIERLLVRR